MEMHIDLGMIKVFLCLRYRVLNDNLRLFSPLDASPQLCAAVIFQWQAFPFPSLCRAVTHEVLMGYGAGESITGKVAKDGSSWQNLPLHQSAF